MSERFCFLKFRCIKLGTTTTTTTKKDIVLKYPPKPKPIEHGN